MKTAWLTPPRLSARQRKVIAAEFDDAQKLAFFIQKADAAIEIYAAGLAGEGDTAAQNRDALIRVAKTAEALLEAMRAADELLWWRGDKDATPEDVSRLASRAKRAAAALEVSRGSPGAQRRALLVRDIARLYRLLVGKKPTETPLAKFDRIIEQVFEAARISTESRRPLLRQGISLM